jgi:hypothetical protein
MLAGTHSELLLRDHCTSPHFKFKTSILRLFTSVTNPYTGCPKNGVLTVHYGVEEITVNARKMLKKFYWTYFLIWRSLKVALNRSIILKYMNEIFMTATSYLTKYKIAHYQYLILHNREFRSFGNRKNYSKSSTVTLQGNDV